VAMLSVVMVALGVYPSLMVPLVESGVQHVLSLVGGA